MHAYTYLYVETAVVPAFAMLVNTHTHILMSIVLSFGAGNQEVRAV